MDIRRDFFLPDFTTKIMYVLLSYLNSITHIALTQEKYMNFCEPFILKR